MLGVIAALLSDDLAIHHFFETIHRIHQGMVDRVVHQVLDGVRLLAVGELDDFLFVAGLAVIGGYDHIDAEAIVLEVVLVRLRVLAMAFETSDNDSGIALRHRGYRDPALDLRFFERQAGRCPGMQA